MALIMRYIDSMQRYMDSYGGKYIFISVYIYVIFIYECMWLLLFEDQFIHFPIELASLVGMK